MLILFHISTTEKLPKHFYRADHDEKVLNHTKHPKCFSTKEIIP